MHQLTQNLQVELFDIKGHNPQTSNCSQNTMQKWRSPPDMERNDGESTASLQCKTSMPVFRRWDNMLTISSSLFFPTLMCMYVCVCFRGSLTQCYKSLMLQQHMWYWTNFWCGLKVKFWFGIIYNCLPTGRLFPISRYCFVLLCSLNLVFPKRVMTVTSMAVRCSFISSKHWTQCQQPNCL